MCVRPIVIKNPDVSKFLGATLSVPCGSCAECLKARQDQWKLRLMFECQQWKYVYFFTLTYNDDSLPITDDGLSTACKNDVQGWIKRFRTNYERSTGVRLSSKLKYFICAEYGPNGTHRPHYHGLFMTDLDEFQIAPLFNEWRERFGFVKADAIACDQGERQAVSNYVSKYCCKGEFASRVHDIEAGLIEKAWTIVSKGVGSSYCDNPQNKRYHVPFGRSSADCFRQENLDICIDRMKISFSTPKGVFTYRMPRYYKERFYHSKMTFVQKRYNFKKHEFEEIKVKRYCTKSLFSRALQIRLRDRFEQKNSIFDYITDISPEALFSLGYRMWLVKKNCLDSRESKARSQLFQFYATNANRWASL